jgi:hypothetical protein
MNDLSQYEGIQHLIDTGDLIEWSGKNVISRAIMTVTRAKVSHTSVAVILPYQGHNRRYIIEANRNGLQFSLLSEHLKRYRGSAWWYRLREQYDPLRPKMGAWLFDELSRHPKYDFGAIGRQLFKRVSVDAGRWFCSEVMDACYIAHGVIKPDPRGARRPGDFVQEGIFSAQARIL